MIYEKYKTKPTKKQGENEDVEKRFWGLSGIYAENPGSRRRGNKKLCKERAQMYTDKIQDVIAVTPSGDLLFVIVALKILTEVVQKIDPKATHMAQRLFDGMSYSSKSGTFNANMTEAAARAYADTLKRK